ncbi:MAG: ParA family protein [Anaerolineae bacterium]|jgi:chromosome partitioning protein|nr:ParA family protein [Anaerolineae bacterium]
MTVLLTIANEKGGVGKTTTAVNLAAGLALRLAEHNGVASRILLVDMDPQCHALLSTAFGAHNAERAESLSAVLTETPPPSLQRMLQPSQHHANLFVIPSQRDGMVEAARVLPTLMANESRLSKAIAAILPQFSYVILDTPPNTGDLLVNALVASTHVLIPVETSYLGVTGLRELQRTIDAVRMHFRPELRVLGYLPTLCDEQRGETQEILAEMEKRYPRQVFPPIHKSTDLAYAHSAHMDIFSYRPPRQRTDKQIASSSRGSQEYALLVEAVLRLTWKQAVGN